jgi:hypothetical protein
MQLGWRRALELVGVDPDSVSIEELAHNRWLTPGIWTVSSEEQRKVLKCLAPDREAPASAWEEHWTARAGGPRRWNYWAREGLAYRHRVVEIYESGGIVAPRLLAAHYGDDAIVLLLEHVEGLPGDQWEIPDYAAAARSLGRAQGQSLTCDAVQEFEWLSCGFLQQYSSEKPVDWSLLDSDNAWEQPLVQRNFPSELRAGAKWLHNVSGRLYEITQRLPRVLSHLDFWTKNLILRADRSIALLDWAFVGDGAIGEDIGNLIPDAAFDHFVPAESLAELEASVHSAYLEGLADAGWTGDGRLAELGLCASAVKYDWLTPAMLAAASAQRQLRYGGTEEVDADYRFRERGIGLLDNVERARRAMRLAEQLDL